MLSLFRNSIRTAVRERTVLFWSLLFPIIMGFFFYIGFSGGKDTEILKDIPTGVVTIDGSGQAGTFETFLHELDGNPLKLVFYDSEKEARDALGEKKISGFYRIDARPSLVINGSQLNESILSQLLQSYLQNEATMKDIAAKRPGHMADAVTALEDYSSYTRETSLGGRTMDVYVLFFFALIGMACMYGSFLGMQKAMELQAYNSALGARRCVTPTHKLKLIVVDMSTTVLLHFINLVILLLVMRYVYGVDFGVNYGLILLITFMGAVIGVSMGFTIASIGKAKEGAKIGIMIGISMVCAFAAGLMFSDIRNVLEKNAPIVNRLNPAALIVDSFYCVSVYDDPVRLSGNLALLGVMSGVLVLLSFLVTRRERYDNI